MSSSEHEQERAAAEARLAALEPLAMEYNCALDEAFRLVVLRSAEGALSGPNCKDELKSALSSACEAACMLVGLDHTRFKLCGGRDKVEPLLEAMMWGVCAPHDLQTSPEVLTRCAALVPDWSKPPPALLGFDEGLKLWKALAAFVAFESQRAAVMQCKEVQSYLGRRE
jgi:hypothetical protein